MDRPPLALDESASSGPIAPVKGGSVITGAFLIAGTSIGAGMLALPFKTGVAGLLPAFAVSALTWLYMLATGLLLLEATLWMPEGANLLSMSRRLLGKGGFFITGAAFLFLYTCLLVAYYAGGVPLFQESIEGLFKISLGHGISTFLFTLLFGGIVFLGARATSRLNFILMWALILSYFALVGTLGSEVKSTNLERREWPLALAAIPTLFSAYGYHNMVPSLVTYLERNTRKLKVAIVIGTSIPFIVYTLWEWVVIGALSKGAIVETLAQGEVITASFHTLPKGAWIAAAGRLFSLFAITTSILGVGLSMVDFLGDGTKIKRTGKGRLLLTSLVFLPPVLFTSISPGLFFAALHYAGGFGEALLNGLMPALFVYVGRYRLKLVSKDPLPGGKLLLLGLMAIASFIFIHELIALL